MRHKHFIYRLALVVLLWIFFGVTLTTALRGDWYTPWRLLNVPTVKPPFFDLRGIPFAIEASHKGLDPYTEKLPAFTPPLNSPWKIEFDYPRAWIPLFSGLAITQDRVVLAALAFIALYLVCLTILIVRSEELLGSSVVFLTAFSSASLLAVERGNNDLLTFALVLLGSQSPAITAFLVLVGLATFLKLYPVAGLAAGGLVKKERLAVGISVCTAAFYFWTQRTDIAKIPNNIPAAFGQSYGVQSIAIGISKAVHDRGGGWTAVLTPLSTHVAIFALALTIVLFSVWKGLKWASRLESHEAPPVQLCFVVFSSIFVSTFLLSPNFEYRLIFLIPTLPYYALLLKKPATRRLAGAAIALTLIAMNGQIFGHFAPWKVLSHLARTLLAPATAYLLGAIIYSSELFKLAGERLGFSRGAPVTIGAAVDSFR